jgi:hypothetical protein
MLLCTDKLLRSAQSGHVGTRTKVPVLTPIESYRSVPEMGMKLTMIKITRSAASRESAHS